MRIAKIKWAMPHCYALIFFIIILVALLTWCIPSGSFDYHSVTLPGGETKTLVIPGSYHLLDKVSSEGDLRQGITAVLAAPMEGIIKAADVVAFVLIVGGAFGIFYVLAQLSGVWWRWLNAWQVKEFWLSLSQ